MTSTVRRLTLALPGVILLALVSEASAQAFPLGGCYADGPSPPFLSQESEIQYGCGYLFRSKPPEPSLALSHFRLALAKNPENAFALYLLGVSHAALNQSESARTALAAALRIDPDVETKLAPRFAEQPSLRARVDAVLGRTTATTEARPTSAAHAPPAMRTQPEASAPQPRARRAARTGTQPQNNNTGRKSGGKLEFGAYACWHHSYVGAPPNARRQSIAKGSITLRENGTYQYRADGGSGRYRYNESTGAISWLSGPLAEMRPEATTFTRERTTSGIEIRMVGDYRWSCGKNNR